MPNYLDIPDDLQSLIEKRELEERRVADRRDPIGAHESPEDERRKAERRSQSPRRKDDEQST